MLILTNSGYIFKRYWNILKIELCELITMKIFLTYHESPWLQKEAPLKKLKKLDTPIKNS